MSQKLLKEIEEKLDNVSHVEAIKIIEKLGMKYRKLSSMRLNMIQYGRGKKVDNDRPDLQSMK